VVGPINRAKRALTAKIAGEFLHCCIAYRNNGQTVLFAIAENKSVKARWRSIRPEDWVIHRLDLTESQKQCMWSLTFHTCRDRMNFSKWRYYLNFVVPSFLRTTGTGGDYFCSEYVTMHFYSANMINEDNMAMLSRAGCVIEPSHAKPTDVLRILETLDISSEVVYKDL
jgi:hypothetical protein